MYINFEQMMTSGLTMSDVGYLLMIRQKEEMASVIPKEKIDSYKASGYIERIIEKPANTKGRVVADADRDARPDPGGRGDPGPYRWGI